MDLDVIALFIIILIWFTMVLCYVWKPPPSPLSQSSATPNPRPSPRNSRKPWQKNRARPPSLSTIRENVQREDVYAADIPLEDLDFPAGPSSGSSRFLAMSKGEDRMVGEMLPR